MQAGKSGGFDVQELQSIKAASAKCLRLARRGRIVYQIFQESNKSPPVILGQMEIGTLPVRNNCLRTLVHTGAPDRTTIVRLRSLTIHAEKID